MSTGSRATSSLTAEQARPKNIFVYNQKYLQHQSRFEHGAVPLQEGCHHHNQQQSQQQQQHHHQQQFIGTELVQLRELLQAGALRDAQQSEPRRRAQEDNLGRDEESRAGERQKLPQIRRLLIKTTQVN